MTQEPPLHTRAVSAVLSALGSPVAIAAAVTILLVWMATGPFLGFSNTWQLIINTSTTIITFLMVFVIQNSQNRDSRATATKLDAILQSLEGVDNRLVGLEEQPEREIKQEQSRVRSDPSTNTE